MNVQRDEIKRREGDAEEIEWQGKGEVKSV